MSSAPPIDLADLRCFLAVLEAGSFSTAARTLGLPKTTVSRRVAALEQHLGARLLERTTRSVKPTPAGADYARRASEAWVALQEAEAALGAGTGEAEVRGRLRVIAHPVYGETVLGPVLAAWVRDFPALTLELELSPRSPDPERADWDLALQTGAPGAGQAGEAVGVLRSGVYASPDLIAAYSGLRYAHELAGLPAVCGLPAAAGRIWTLTDGRQDLRLEMHPMLHTDSPPLMCEAAEAGLGVALLPVTLGEVAVQRGSLARLFPAWHTAGETVHAVWPECARLPARVRQLVDRLQAARDGGRQEE